MKLEDPIELASCGPMELGLQIGRDQTDRGQMMKPQQDARLASNSSRSEPMSPITTTTRATAAATNTTTTTIVEQQHTTRNKSAGLEPADDALRVTSKIEAQHRRGPRLSDKRHMAPASKQPRKHHRHHYHNLQQQHVFPGGHNVAHGDNLLLQDHIKNFSNQLAARGTNTPAGTANSSTTTNGLSRPPAQSMSSSASSVTSTNTNTTTATTISASDSNQSGSTTASAAADLASSMTGLLSECFRQQETNTDHYQSHHNHNHNHQHNHHQSQLRLASGGVESFMSSTSAAMAAQAAAVRQQHQRSQEILEQFASLHSLSAVASAIQQSHQHHLELPQSSPFMTQQQQQQQQASHHPTINQHHHEQHHQFDLAHQLQQHSQQLQFSLANLTLNNNNNQSVASNSVPSNLTSPMCASRQTIPIDLHRIPGSAGGGGASSGDSPMGAVTASSHSSVAQSALMGMMRDSLMSRLAPVAAAAAAAAAAGLQGGANGIHVQQPTPSFVHFAHNQKSAATSGAGYNTSGLQERANNSGAGGGGSGAGSGSSTIRVGRRRGSRKCRKIYGMAQRQLWCTQCKWKKACSRFFGVNQSLVAGGVHTSSPGGTNVVAASMGATLGLPASGHCCTPLVQQFRQTAPRRSGGIK
uniref:Zinc finger protein 704 n=1 Tax=Aceria tosichella TaxID=561515 RepID=A0A6G1S8W1_9ACAR